MPYYIRSLTTGSAVPPLPELRKRLPREQDLLLQSGEEDNWSQLILRHKTGEEIAVIERNPVRPGELGQDELDEFIDEVRNEKPESAAKWLAQFLPRVKVIYAFQVLHAADANGGWEGIRSLQNYIWDTLGGIFQADLEGFSNEQGHHILWQFIKDHTGPWQMAVLDSENRWIAFEMDLGNLEHKNAFLSGRVPDGVKRL